MKTSTLLPPRQCHLDEESHKYFHDGLGQQMGVSVTGVVNWFKPPYSGPEEASWRGTHVHRFMYYKAMGQLPPGCDHLGEFSPEGVDCLGWIQQLGQMKFWDEIEVLACEYTMTSARKSLGGQLDLLCRYKNKTLLVDLKTKGSSWKGSSKEDRYSYSAQAGGYLQLLQAGDGAYQAPAVDQCRTLVVTPNQVKWLPSMDPDRCSLDWEECWGAYLLDIKNKF